MTVQIVFFIIAVATLGAALMVVTARNLVHAALWLVVALFGVAVFYALLNAGFLAVAQVVVYIGAIAILMIFAIMLTRRVAQDVGPRYNDSWGWAAGLGLLIFGALVWVLAQWGDFAAAAPAMGRDDTINRLGIALVSPDAYVLPFELASVLLLAALVGSLIVAWDRK